MDNSLEILQGTSTDTITKQYGVLAYLIKEYNGKTHGSQSHILANDFIQIIVYYEIPEGKREEIKEKLMILSETKKDLILILIDNNREEISKIKRELVDHSSISDLLPLSIFPITC